MNSDASSCAFSVEILNAGVGWTWADAATITGTLTNYAVQV